MSERRLTYSFGPLERRGLFGPLRAGQVGLVAIVLVQQISVHIPLAFHADKYYWRDLGRPQNVAQAEQDLKGKVFS